MTTELVAPRPSAKTKLKTKVKTKTQKEEEHPHVEKNIYHVIMGRYKMKTWYHSPYPDEYGRAETLWICPFCFKYMLTQMQYDRHKAKCRLRHPPGDEIYRAGGLSFFEVDGRRQTIYCRNLCLFTKLFLDHKSVDADVTRFLFYVLTENDSEGCHIVGYFSQNIEWNSDYCFHLACILTMPQHQRKGFGKVLIEFSYIIAKAENRLGGPEKPLSDLGKSSFMSYWKDAIFEFLADPSRKECTIDDIVAETYIQKADVQNTIREANMVKLHRNMMVLHCHPKPRKPRRRIDRSRIHWVPLPTMIEKRRPLILGDG